MSTLVLPLILFLGFIGFRIASIMATRKREAELRAAWRAEVEAQRAATASVAQELRVPLSAIMSEAERLQANVAGPTPAELSAALATIRAAGARAHTLVDGLLVDPDGGTPR